MSADDGATGPARCPERARTERGWETCHRDQHPADEPHHVTDRSWFTLDRDHGRKTPGLRLGVPCGEACRWPDRITPYAGYVPNPEPRGPRSYVTNTYRPKRRTATG